MHVAALTLYPVKSLGGLSVPSAEVEPRGLAGDRRWMLVDATGAVLTQRTVPELALWTARPTEGGLVLRPPHGASHAVQVPSGDAARIHVEVWGDRVEARVCDDRTNRWLSKQVGVSIRLVYQPDEVHRPTDPDYAPGGVVSFADGFPILITHTASLDDLNGRLERPVGMDRFRPNLVVAGGEPFAEDQWERLRAGGVVLRLIKPCARCSVVTVDPATGDIGQEPLRTLAAFRRRDGKVYFGQNAVPEALGVVQVGDPVEVLRYRGTG